MLKIPSILTALFFDTEEEYQEALTAELENRDYYTADNVFWVPASARWQALQEVSILNTGAELPWGGKFSGVAKLIDDAFDAIEKRQRKTQRRPPTHQRLCRKRRHPARADYPLLRY